MYFLNSIWLIALAAVSIPVIIHLWNIRRGKTLKVGSISLFEEASRKSSRSFNLLEVLLLILRCLLLILLALLLAIPMFSRQVKVKRSKGWILVPKEIFNETYLHFKKPIDSLNHAGFEFHFYNNGLPAANLNQLLTSKLKDSTASTSNYWNLLKQVNAKVPASIPVYLFTTNQLRHFTGTKPQVALNLHWQTFTPADSMTSWIEKAYFTNNNSIRIVQGTSKPSGTAYSYYNVQGDGANSPIQITVNNGEPFVNLKNSKSAAVAVDTSVNRIAIYTDNFTTDAAYPKAALQTVTEFTQHKSFIKTYNNAALINGKQNWVFWLSEKPVPQSIIAHTQNVFSYKTSKVNSVNSWIATEDMNGLPRGQEHINLFKRVNASGNANEILWHDGFGQPLLSLQKTRNANFYQFYTRFNPSWSDLVWNDQFPKLMLQLLNNDHLVSKSEDKRAIAPNQILPLKTTNKEAIADKFAKQVNLSHYFWLALIVLLLAERWLSGKQKLATQNG